MPEPGIVMYGTVTGAGGGGAVTISSMSWTVSDGQGNLFALTGNVQTVVVNSVTYYVFRIPFDTRSINGPSSGVTNFSPPGNSFALSASSPTYIRTATINGTTASFVDVVKRNFTLTAAQRGLIEEVDLTLPGLGGAYGAWVASHFTASEQLDQSISGPNADPDGDGLTNAQEYAAGTDPKDPLSALKVVSVQPGPTGGFTFTWKAVNGTTYAIEKTTDFQNWNQLTTVTATGATASYTDATPGAVPAHYRIRASH